LINFLENSIHKIVDCKHLEQIKLSKQQKEMNLRLKNHFVSSQRRTPYCSTRY